MEISRKMDYALRMISELVRSPEEIISVRLAAERNAIPYSFARAIQHDLVQAGMLKTARGPHGGMCLQFDPKTTSLLELVEVIQGPVYVSTCDVADNGEGPCPFRSECHFNPIWCEAERMLRDYFNSVTLHQVVVENCVPTLLGGHVFELATAAEMRQRNEASKREAN